MFDGDIGRLTGLVLKQHVQQIASIPPAAQQLTFQNMPIHDTTTGYELGLHDGCTILLAVADAGGVVAAASSGVGENDEGYRHLQPVRTPSDAAAAAAAGTGRFHAPYTNSSRSGSAAGRFQEEDVAVGGGRGVAPPHRLPNKSRLDYELETIQRQQQQQHQKSANAAPFYSSTPMASSSSTFQSFYTAGGTGAGVPPRRGGAHEHPATPSLGINESHRGGDVSSSSAAAFPHRHREALVGTPTTTALVYPNSGLYDDVDVDVEIIEESGAPLWHPTSNSIDGEEQRLLQQDYIWKMEQVRFETERMNREREMLRQKQELDYQAELLERERIELERRTHSEKLKLQLLQATLHDEMAIEAKVSTLAEESVWRARY